MNIFSRHGLKAATLTIAALMVIGGACSRQARSKSQVSNQASNQPGNSSDPTIEVSSAGNDSSSDDPCSEMFSNFFLKVDSIAYGEYEVVRLHKTVHDDFSNSVIPASYAVLKSRGKTVATFDGIHYGLGNATDFGFASLLGPETRQLIVSLTAPRSGRHWIVDLSSNAATVFDSNDWDVGAEDVCIHDFDGDGVEEISLPITKFWGFGSMAMSESPLPSVVFKYEPGIRKYQPDKSALARGLEGIEADVQAIDPNEKPKGPSMGPYLAMRLDIFLRYVYAGRENDAWAFFEKTYNLGDKKEIEQKIKATLEREPVYRFVFGKSRS
ncbi:MAG TPA: hypothetical protein VN937_01890 [Blastocatellia bacterium]|nr:hypothetical protein [Blastocatellia bacterium]